MKYYTKSYYTEWRDVSGYEHLTITCLLEWCTCVLLLYWLMAASDCPVDIVSPCKSRLVRCSCNFFSRVQLFGGKGAKREKRVFQLASLDHECSAPRDYWVTSPSNCKFDCQVPCLSVSLQQLLYKCKSQVRSNGSLGGICPESEGGGRGRCKHSKILDNTPTEQ